MTPDELFLNCISAYLRGGTAEAELSGEDWLLLIRLAQEQKMLPMVFEAAGGSMPEALRTDCGKLVRRLVAAQTVRTAGFLSVYTELTAAGITPLVVKGIVCRALYPKPDLRSSADEDLYIPPAEYPAFHGKMLELGFEAGEPDYKNSHEERYIRGGLLIEGHWELFPRDSSALNALNGYNDSFFSRAKTRRIEGAELLTLDDTDHMIFLLLHAYKHFINSGVGLRQICDIALWAKAYALDWQRIKDAMGSISGEYFAAAIFDAAEKLCGMSLPAGWPEADCTALIADALRGGVYGSSDMSRRHSGTMTLSAVEAARESKTHIPLMRTLFPNRAVMEVSFPWVRKSAALLPCAWTLRILRYLGRQGEGDSAAESIRIGARRTELLREYKIIE